MEIELGLDEYLEVENPGYSGREVFEKGVDGRSVSEVLYRDTSFYEEWKALKTFHQRFPSYFPEPFYAVRRENGSPLDPDPVRRIGMERLDVDGCITEVSADEYPVEELFQEAVEMVREFHSDRYTPPHGDLNGNIWVLEDSSVVFGDPKGTPRSIHERRRMRDEDMAHLELIADELGVEGLDRGKASISPPKA